MKLDIGIKRSLNRKTERPWKKGIRTFSESRENVLIPFFA